MVKKYVREELEKITVKELRKMCRTYGINIYTHSRSLKKDELIDKLMGINTFVLDTFGTNDNKYKNIKMEGNRLDIKVANRSGRYVSEYEVEGTDNGKVRNFDYDRMMVGCFIAFRYRGKSDTAKIYAINRKRRLVKAETKLGTRYLIPFERIIWVKFEKEELWPKKVFMELKGYNKCNWEGVDGEPYREDKRSCQKIISD